MKYKDKKDLRVIFVGIPDMALVCLTNLIEAGFNIVGVVPPKNSHETFQFFKNYVSQQGLNFLEYGENPNAPELIEKLKALNADIGVVCSFNTKLSKDFLNTTKMGYINSHPSKLPLYRGACPYFHIVNDGVKESGITLHFMDESFDTGDIVCQKLFEVSPKETMGTLFNRTTYMISDALIETLNRLIEKGELETKPQEKGEFVEAHKVGGEFRIRWNNPIEKIDRLIRASNPFFSAFSLFRGVSVKILRATPIKQEHNFRLGHIVEAKDGRLLIAAMDGFLSVEFMSVGTWGYFSARDFIETFSPSIDEVFI